MVLIRFILISLIVYLLIRSFFSYQDNDESFSRGADQGGVNNSRKNKGVSKDVGEYVDYEEVDE